MNFKEFVEQIMKKHNIKTSVENVLKAIKIEYEEEANKNKVDGVGVVGLDDATLEAIIVEAEAVLERDKKKKEQATKTGKTETKKETTVVKESSDIKTDDDTREFLEQLGLWG